MTSDLSRRTGSAPAIRTESGDRLTLFAAMWAAAALFHVVGTSGAALAVLTRPTVTGVAQALLAICAVWVLTHPDRTLPLLVLATLGLGTAWLEAPVLGSHWVLAAFVDLALLLSVPVARRPGGVDRARLAQVFLPVARWCLVLFYAFAAFSKLNTDFFDTAVSCSNVYFDETFGSATVGAGGAAQLLPFATAATELSIPLLLAFRPTRVAGVVLGLLFHSAVALDVVHPFSDFSAVLAALFITFLPGGFGTSAVTFLRGRGARLVRFWVSLGCVVVAIQWIGAGISFQVASRLGAVVLWLLIDAVVLAGVGSWLVRHRVRYGEERPFALRAAGPAWTAVVPLLLVVTGVLPYVELRTASAFTMYSNLRTVDGTSNHLLVRSSLPLAGRQSDLVTVISSSDPGLAQYGPSGYLLPWDSFRAYLADRPDTAVTYERGGRRVTLARASDDPSLVTPPALLVRKLLGLRAVDGGDRNRCQTTFLPAL